MFVKVNANNANILAINIVSGSQIELAMHEGKYTLNLIRGSGNNSTSFGYVDTPEQAIQVFENLMDKLEAGHYVCHINELL